MAHYNERLSDLCKAAGKGNEARQYVVAHCKALKNCESLRYRCRAWQCNYDGEADAVFQPGGASEELADTVPSKTAQDCSG